MPPTPCRSPRQETVRKWISRWTERRGTIGSNRRLETRGSVAFLLPIGALVVLLVLDVRFPLLFWNLRHGLEVYGGEPTDWYYAMQRVSRITSIIGVFVLAAMSFAVH